MAATITLTEEQVEYLKTVLTNDRDASGDSIEADIATDILAKLDAE
jgi:hypothetical protein